MVLYLSLALSALFALVLIYRYDMYEKEPVWMIALAAGAGALIMSGVGRVEDFTLDQYGPPPRPAPLIAIVAATHEEIARLALVILIAIFFRRQFNDPMDGIIYGSVIGLGMAVEESVFFTSLWGTPTTALLPGTELVRLCGHLLLGGITGFGVGMARMRMRGWGAAVAACAAAAIILHFAWDWLAFSVREGRMTTVQTILAVAIMLSGMLLYGALVVVGSDWSRRHFAPHKAREIIGWPMSLFLPRRDKGE